MLVWRYLTEWPSDGTTNVYKTPWVDDEEQQVMAQRDEAKKQQISLHICQKMPPKKYQKIKWIQEERYQNKEKEKDTFLQIKVKWHKVWWENALEYSKRHRGQEEQTNSFLHRKQTRLSSPNRRTSPTFQWLFSWQSGNTEAGHADAWRGAILLM